MFEISSQTSKKYMMSSQILLGTTSDKYFQIIFRSIMKTEISSRLFYDFTEITIQCGLLILSSWCLLRLIVYVHTFKTAKNSLKLVKYFH